MFKLDIFVVILASLGGLSAGNKCSSDSQGINLLPQCSVDEFIDGALRCVKMMGKGFPYNSKDQCLGNMDDMIGCMTSHVKGCLQTDCPSIITSIDGISQVLPMVNDALGKIKSLDDIYSAIDGGIDGILQMVGDSIQLPDGILDGGVKNIQIPISLTTQLTVHEILTQVTCPKPGQMPDFLKSLLSAADIPRQIEGMRMGNTTNEIPFCDGNFVWYLANNGWQYLQGWFAAANRAEYCKLQKSFATVLDTVMFKKCDLSHVYDFLPAIDQTFMPLVKSVIKRVKKAPAILLDINGCLVSMDVKLKFKQIWEAGLANETSDAYKAASQKATEALQMMMGSKKEDLLTVLWSFDEEGVATASVPLMGDESVYDMQRQFESFDIAQVESLAQISVEPTPGNSGSIVRQLSLFGYITAFMLPIFFLWLN